MEADAFMSEQLLLMGFDQEAVSAALIATNNASVDAALEALLSKSYLSAAPSSRSSRPPNPINPTNPIPNSHSPSRLPDAKAIEKARAEEREQERQRLEKERLEREKRRAEREKAREEMEDDEIDDDMYEGYDDDEDDDAALADETLEDIVAAKSETAVVLDKSQIQESAAKEIERIATITDTSLSTAGALLRAFQWNSEKLLERYYENPEKVMKEAGVTASAPATKGSLRTSANPIKPKVAPTECEICGDDLDSSNSCTLECFHVFCRECLTRYLEVQVNEGKALEITCMAFKCTGRVPDNLIRKFTSPEIYTKYTAFVSKSFVEDNPNIKWCPRAGCGNAVKSDVKSISEAQCSCGFKFCFKCNGEAHAPATCLMMKAWIKKCQDDSETSNWISANTKDCPKCRSAIEKNGGCNHMTCRKCKYEFCWICMGNWSGHSSCNKFVEDGNKSMDRASLERYLHYFHRYQTHVQSQKLEQTMREAAVVKMVSIQNTDSNRWIDVQYIDTATEQLIECRRTLKYTYVFAFYMTAGPEKNLFEYLQGELEKTTEQLSGYLEAPVGAHTPRQIKDVTGLAAKRLQHLREGVDEMMENPAKLPIEASVAEPSTETKAAAPAAKGKAKQPEPTPPPKSSSRGKKVK